MTPSELQVKWDTAYSAAQVADHAPAAVLARNSHLLPRNGNALDLACGMGANAVFLARAGLNTLAVDISPVAVQRINDYAQAQQLPLHAQARDLEHEPLAANQFDVITVSHYLDRDITAALISALKPKGLLLYQTFTVETTSANTPRNPKFLLQPNELLKLFSSLRVLYYQEEGLVGDITRGTRNLALLVAQKD